MKLIVFSDAHGNKEAITTIIANNPVYDYIISLGDSELQDSFLQQFDIIAIKGNYPRDAGFLFHSELEVGGKKLFLTHGHKFGVHKSLVKLSNHAINNGYDLVLYGHTHIARYDKAGSCLLVNPGSIKSPRNALPPSFLIIEITDGEFNFKFMDVNTNEVIKEK